jgi:hypothetical protein
VKNGNIAASINSFHILLAYSSIFGMANKTENIGNIIESTIRSACLSSSVTMRLVVARK